MNTHSYSLGLACAICQPPEFLKHDFMEELSLQADQRCPLSQCQLMYQHHSHVSILPSVMLVQVSLLKLGASPVFTISACVSSVPTSLPVHVLTSLQCQGHTCFRFNPESMFRSRLYQILICDLMCEGHSVHCHVHIRCYRKIESKKKT